MKHYFYYSVVLVLIISGQIFCMESVAKDESSTSLKTENLISFYESARYSQPAATPFLKEDNLFFSDNSHHSGGSSIYVLDLGNGKLQELFFNKQNSTTDFLKIDADTIFQTAHQNATLIDLNTGETINNFDFGIRGVEGNICGPGA